MKGLIIAAPRSGAGKTTVSLGLMRALSHIGVRVQPFKCGPDYIDPAFHAIATGRASFNLDTWAMDRALLRDIVDMTKGDCDIAIVEGVMGLFDGASGVGQTGSGSTADLAALTGWPVVLVIDVVGQAETAAAVALGLARYRSDVAIAGVILNRVASERHLALIRLGLERTGLALLGAFNRDERVQLPERHLGLVQAGEIADIDARMNVLAATVAGAVDVGALRNAAQPLRCDQGVQPARPRVRPPGQRIALASDVAFSFMYEHLRQQWRNAGAELVPFSPLADEAPDPSADAVWLPGGYPELHAGQLAAAERFRQGLAALAARGVAVHGECGGYMVLGQGLADARGERHAMVGLLGLEASFAQRKLHLGYRQVQVLVDCALGAAGTQVRGHEFHYATVLGTSDEPLAVCRDATGMTIAETGSRRGSVSGTFFHMIA